MVSTMKKLVEVRKGSITVMLGTGSKISCILADAYVLPIAAVHKTPGGSDYFTDIFKGKASRVHNEIGRQKRDYLKFYGVKAVRYGTAFETRVWEFDHVADLFAVVSRRDGTGWAKGVYNAIFRFTDEQRAMHSHNRHDGETQQNIMLIPLGPKTGFAKRTAEIIKGVSNFAGESHDHFKVVLFAEEKMEALAKGLVRQVRGIFRQG